ncbi:hypothetical protein OG320_05340 [Microbispora sp. NBC_01189]|uniref:hypothetical protein n=1 Tax=Microbispora sp. NBC_01189 TaxID=2903583 RepID=UPI002E12DFF5|nr:hypothetical protein OG320_05340 [Microbispora sp. NBC_01189]
MIEQPPMYFVTANEMHQLNEHLEDLAEIDLGGRATDLVEQIGFVLDEVHFRTFEIWTQTRAETERMKREAAKADAE